MREELLEELRRTTTPAAARALQTRLAGRVDASGGMPVPRLVAGTDVGFEDGGRTARGAVVVLDFPALTPVDHAVSRLPAVFPYITGLLSFREVPVLVDAYRRLNVEPDLILVDGAGLAHPRRFGLACHLGVIVDRPTIGVAKSRLIGEFTEPGLRKGRWTPLTDHGETIGAVLRSRDRTRPLFVSIGHRISLEAALGYVLACCRRYRLPETTRAAHRLASGR